MRECYIFPSLRALTRWAASVSIASCFALPSDGVDAGLGDLEQGRSAPARSPLANVTNSPAQRQGGPKAPTFELY